MVGPVTAMESRILRYVWASIIPSTVPVCREIIRSSLVGITSADVRLAACRESFPRLGPTVQGSRRDSREPERAVAVRARAVHRHATLAKREAKCADINGLRVPQRARIATVSDSRRPVDGPSFRRSSGIPESRGHRHADPLRRPLSVAHRGIRAANPAGPEGSRSASHVVCSLRDNAAPECRWRSPRFRSSADGHDNFVSIRQ